MSKYLHLTLYFCTMHLKMGLKGREGTKLYGITLSFYLAQGDGPKGQFAVEQLRIVEILPPYTFGKDYTYLFQVS